MTEKEAKAFLQRIMEWLGECPLSKDDIDKYIIDKAKQNGLIKPEVRE
jgi:cysteine synthase